MPIRKRVLTLGLALAAAILLPSAHRPSREDVVWQHRNLGKAFYENPTTQKEAVEEFRRALELNPGSARERLNYGLALLRAGQVDGAITELRRVEQEEPSLPHPWFNLGVAWQNQGNSSAAIEQFQGLLRLAPGEPVSHYHLGVLYRQQGRLNDAITEFETAARLDAGFAAPRFQLFSAYRSLNRTADAGRVLAEFRALKAKQDKPDAEAEDVNWSVYSEIYDPIEDRGSRTPAAPRLRFRIRDLPGTVDPATARMLVLDFDGDGRPDLLVWSDRGILLYRGGTELVDRGLAEVRHVVWVAAGDSDDDGLTDLCVVTTERVLLFHNDRTAGFQARPLPVPGAGFRRAVWLDYDHDRDLDLILLGHRSMLLRNDGSAGWEDRSGDFPFVPGHASDAVALRFSPDDTKSFDLLVSYTDRSGVLYRDRLNGRYEAVEAGGIPLGAAELTATASGVAFLNGGRLYLARDRQGQLASEPETSAGRALVAADLANTGTLQFHHEGLPDAVRWAAADFRGNGLTDMVGVTPKGGLQYVSNLTRDTGAWLTVQLEGVKSLKIPVAAEIEVKAGALYQRRRYEGIPVTFGLGDWESVDTIRITWPNGMIQNEVRQAARRRVRIKELPRLSGSCPMIFAWNGRGFRFITDVLGVAPLGASSGDGQYFPVDHDEYVQIPGSALALKDGRYAVRITEELNEVSYLDQVRLLALDHAAGTEIFTNEKWKGPPYPEFRLFGVKRRIYPVSARDDRGRDLLAAVLRRDQVYAGGFERDAEGVAETHALELDFAPGSAASNRAVLILNGWVDWADGSTFRKAAQTGHPLVPPQLQVKDASGRWRTVIDDMGMPSGKTKTIAVDLTGRFLSPARSIRIVTNMCVYWDEIFLGEDASAPETRLTPADAAAASLRFRGFSRIHVDPQRRQPESFDYDSVTPVSNWNPTPGVYTRYGDVRELVRSVDDRLVVMGSGDELQLSYDPAGLPALPPGWARDFLLLVDGWAKDADANTAFSQNVEPLPFHGMSRYPYPAGESFPADTAHRVYLRQYNTRQELHLIRSLKP